MKSLDRTVRVNQDVTEAIESGRGVVALESTLIAHGLPWPTNLETALASEAAVRASGSTPATIAVLAGETRIGLTEGEIERIARLDSVLKASRRDLAWAVAQGRDAATTVSATLWLARQAGIGIMATGGLGGVHRDAGITFDISTDLEELASANGSVVVCSGVKSILDVAATLEVMETRGIAVLGYGTRVFPGFTTVSSGLPLEQGVDSLEGAASWIRSHRALGLPGAMVVAQPVAAEVAIDRDSMEAALHQALADARRQAISGKAVTPFLLDRIQHATAGRSLLANASLIVANARLAGRLAAALADSIA
jgi:pseudouridine-5'-phosphate glycosidase